MRRAQQPGVGIFRQRIPGRPDFEASVPLTRGERNFTIPFDNRSSFSTGIALVNLDTVQQTISVVVRTALGAVVFQESVVGLFK